MTRNHIPVALAAILAVLLLAPVTAGADTLTARNSAQITVPQQGSASPSPTSN